MTNTAAAADIYRLFIAAAYVADFFDYDVLAGPAPEGYGAVEDEFTGTIGEYGEGATDEDYDGELQ